METSREELNLSSQQHKIMLLGRIISKQKFIILNKIASVGNVETEMTHNKRMQSTCAKRIQD